MIQVGRYEWLFLNIITIFISYLLIHRLSIVKLGEDFSTNLGINYQATWLIIIMCVSLTTAVNVMVVGTLPFIGVIIPNILRIQSGDLLAHSMSAVMIYGADSRFGLIYQVLGFQPIKDFVIEDQRHGQSVSFEGILDLNPDRIFVIDRTQAIGSDNSANADLVENALIKETKAYQNDQIHFLSSQLWYVSGSGLESTHLQIQEIANLMQP